MSNSFETLVRLYMAVFGATEVATREGVFTVKQAPLGALLPFLAWRVTICSRIMFSSEAVSVDAVASRESMNVDSTIPVVVLDRRAVMGALVWVLGGPVGKRYDLRPVDDEISRTLLTFTGELPVQSAVNEALLSLYRSHLSELHAERLLQKSRNIDVMPEVS